MSLLAANRLMDSVVTQQLRARERSGAGVEEFFSLISLCLERTQEGTGEERKEKERKIVIRKNLRSSEKKIENARNK